MSTAIANGIGKIAFVGHHGPMLRLASIVLIVVAAAGCTSDVGDTTSPPPFATSSPPVESAPSTASPGSTSVSASLSPTPTSPASPTVPADVPTTGPNAKASERPPVLPVEATRRTPEGARAFAEFFLQTVDWGYATTSSTYMRRYFQPSCLFCGTVRASLDNAQKAGGHYIGGRLTVLRTAAAVPARAARAELSVPVRISVTAGELVSANGKASQPDVAHTNISERVRVIWRDGRWLVTYVGESI